LIKIYEKSDERISGSSEEEFDELNELELKSQIFIAKFFGILLKTHALSR
jgi:hypothetical protein